MTTSTLTGTCQQILREGPLAPGTGGGYGVLRCAAEADESGFCSVHRGARPRLVPPPIPMPKRDLNADVLPWDDGDRAIFKQHASTKRR